MAEVDLLRGREVWVELTEENYTKEVIEPKKPVMVEFWGPKCKDCIALAPAIQKLVERYPEVKFCRFKCPSKFAVLELGVRNLPTFYFYRDGERTKILSKENATIDNVEKALDELVVHHRSEQLEIPSIS